jgi:hypothetical protein
MDIAYVTRSVFLHACVDAIRAGRTSLDSGGVVVVILEDGGYGGRVEVTIRADDTAAFGTDWENSDVSRFPARIRAAATALRDEGCFGRYVIEHRDGALTIRVA